MATHNPKIVQLASHLTNPIQSSSSSHKDARRSDPDDDDDDAIFAELEAEIENDDDVGTRERGMQELKRE